METNGKRKTNGKRSTAVILIPSNAHIPEWVQRSRDARISIGRINGGRTVRRLDIDFVQPTFAEKGSVLVRSSGSRYFAPFLGPGVALAINDREGSLILNRHVCPACFENAGRFARKGKEKLKLREEGGYRIYLFECGSCQNQWEVPFPISKPNGNGNGSGHHFDHVMREYTLQHLDSKPQRRG